MRNRIKIFVHIPKTAGSSFSQVIRENEKHVLDFKGIRSIVCSGIQDNTLIKGHMLYGINSLGLFQPRYITFLRDPIERCVSWYYFVQEWYKHPSYLDAKNNDIESFYRIRRYQDVQTRYIGGHVLFPFQRFPAKYILDVAKRRLKSKFDFGITENYEQSVRLLCSRLDWPNKPIIHTRQAKLRPKTENISNDIKQTLMELNKADMELYSYAIKIFRKRCQESGVELDTHGR